MILCLQRKSIRPYSCRLRFSSVLPWRRILHAGVREYWIVDPKSRKVTVYDFEHDELPASYTFNDKVPLMISNGEFSVDFVKIRRVLER